MFIKLAYLNEKAQETILEVMSELPANVSKNKCKLVLTIPYKFSPSIYPLKTDFAILVLSLGLKD